MNKLIFKFEKKFQNNPLIVSSIKKMLEIDEEYWIDFINLKELIPPYDQIINYFQKVEDDNQPSKNEETTQESPN